MTSRRWRRSPRRWRCPSRRTRSSSGSRRPAAGCPPRWRATILEAIDAGLAIHSGLHTFLGDDPEFAAAAAMAGVEIVDYRRPPERNETAVGRRHEPGKRVILTVGTDCAIGKMSVALELRKSALAAGDTAVFVPTGQTGMMIDGWGVAVDRVISDFVQGTVEWMLEEGEARGDWIIVEGQGSLDHPAYSSVTLGLIHGATPHAMVMVHKPGLAEHDFEHLPDASFPIARLPDFIRLARDGGRARRAVEGRGGRPEHDALRGRRRGAPDRRADRGRDRPADGRPGALRGGRAVADDPCRPSRRCHGSATRCPGSRMTLRLRHEVLRLALRDPFRIARSDHDAGQVVTTVVVELEDDRFPGLVGVRRGLPGPVLRRDARDDGGGLPAAPRRGRSAGADRRPGCWPPATRCATRSAGTAGRSARSTPRSTISSGRSPGGRSTSCSACRRDLPPTDFTIGLDEPAVVAERARRASGFPALKIKCGGPADLATLRAVREVYDGPLRVDANTGWTPEIALAAPAGARRTSGSSSSSSPSRPGVSTGWPISRGARPCRSSRTSRASRSRTSTRSSGSSRG